jgi:lysophospholipase L1-like esterase
VYAAKVISIVVIGSLLCLGVRPAMHAGRTPLRMLALGDSYTIGESVAVVDRYPVQLVTRLRDSDRIFFDNPEIIATTGWTTGNLLDALSVSRPAGPYALVTLLIGVNDQYQGRSPSEYRAQLTTLLEQAIGLAGNTRSHVLVLSIPDYSVTPFGRSAANPSRIAAQIDIFNAIGQRVAADHGVAWLDITTESRRAADDLSLVAGDGLHFSGKEYQRWAMLMEPIVRKMRE